MTNKRLPVISTVSPPTVAPLAGKRRSGEMAYRWLGPILRLFDEADDFVTKQVNQRRSNKERLPACSPGCHACCLNPAVPMTSEELKAISWYVTEVTTGEQRARLRTQLAQFDGGAPCPFLLDGYCGIRPVRPLICRLFHVLETPCAEGEHVDKERPGDMWALAPTTNNLLVSKLLVLNGDDPTSVKNHEDLIANHTRELLDLPLAGFVKMIDAFDKKGRIDPEDVNGT